MKQNSHYSFKIILCFLLFYSVQNLSGQPSAEFDDIVFKVFNLQFSQVPGKIENLKKTSPQIANYLTIDYLWWKLISRNSEANEAAFLTSLNELKNKTSEYQDYDRLIYFTYQIRYENLKNKNLSKYLSLLKFHFFMENINPDRIKNPDSFVLSMFQLMNELQEFMKYKFYSDYGFRSSNNLERCRTSLQKIEAMQNDEYNSFDIVKNYLLAKIYLEIENDNQKASAKFSKLSELFPENAVFKEALAECKNKLIIEPFSLKNSNFKSQ